MSDNDPRLWWLGLGVEVEDLWRRGFHTLQQIRARCDTLLQSNAPSSSGRTVGRLAWQRGFVLPTSSLFLAVLCGCASVSTHSTPDQIARVEKDISRLQADLVGLSSESSAEEGARLARTAVNRARELARNYRAVRPAWLQNTYVNIGVRERGLCYQWADDLEQALGELHLESFVISRCVARRGTYREHNALVVTGRSQTFWAGLILDAWRRSGLLHWGPVSKDHYPWSPACNHPTCAAAPRP